MLRRLSIIVLVALCGWSWPAGADEPVIWQDVIDSRVQEIDRLIADADAALLDGRRWDAVESYAAAADLAPENVAPLAFELNLRTESREWASVIERSERIAVDLAPVTDITTAQALFFRAVALAATERYAEGAELLERITRFQAELPDASIYYGNLAELHMALGNLDQAAIYFRQAIESGGGASARMGLSVALYRQGLTDEATMQLMTAVVADPRGEFLEETGVFFVPEGEVFLYRALTEIGLGNHDAANTALDSFETSVAGEGEDELVRLLRDRARSTGAEIQKVTIAGCIPTHGALHPDRTHVAVICEYDGVREIALDDGAVRTESAPGYYSYTRSDITFSPDGDHIRVLHSDGSCAIYDRSAAVFGESSRVYYEQYTLTPQRFVGDGDRILVTASHTGGGFQVDGWDSAPLQTHLSYPVGSTWLQYPQISEDDRLMSMVDGTVIRTFEGPSWVESTRVQMTTEQSRFRAYGLSPSGRWIVTAHGSTLVRYSTANGRPTAVVSLTDVAPEVVTDSYVGVSFIRAIDDEIYLIGTSGSVYIVRLG